MDGNNEPVSAFEFYKRSNKQPPNIKKRKTDIPNDNNNKKKRVRETASATTPITKKENVKMNVAFCDFVNDSNGTPQSNGVSSDEATFVEVRKVTKFKESPKNLKIKRQEQTASGNFLVDDSDSVRTGKGLFSWMIHPTKVDTFFREFWEKKPLIIKRNDDYYKSLLSSDCIDKILRKNTLYFTKNVDITSYSRETGRVTQNPTGRATAAQVWKFYNEGYTVRILNPQTFSSRIHSFNASLQEFFGCFVGANVYLTPKNSQGFAPHYDDIEAFVVQLEGAKLWKLYAPRTQSEILPRYSSPNFSEDDLGPPIQEIILQAGDFMYFPRGFIHQGVSLKYKHSLHITLSVYQKNSWADFLEKLLPVALQTAVEEDPSFREGLPLHCLDHLGLVHSDKTTPIRKEFTAKLHSLFEKLLSFAPVDAAVDQLAKRFIHDALPPFIAPTEKEVTVFAEGTTRIKNGLIIMQPKFDFFTEIKLLRYNCIRLLHEEDTIRLYYSVNNSKEYHGEEPQYLEIPEDYAPVIDALVESYPKFVSIQNLPALDNEDKIEFIKEIWRAGIIKTKKPLLYNTPRDF